MPNIILQDCNGCTNNYSKLYLLLLQLLSTSMFSAQGAGHQQTERRVWTWDNPTLFHDWPKHIRLCISVLQLGSSHV
jgi:hypothetical protein